MVSIRKQVTKCVADACDEAPTHNYVGKRPIWCETHARRGSVNIVRLQRCGTLQCRDPPFAIYEGVAWCITHYPDTARADDASKLCKYHDQARGSFVCDECKVASKSHWKEWSVVCALKRTINLKPVSLDARLAGSDACDTRRRPDILYETMGRLVIVEVDEKQHIDRESTCECARVSEIAGTAGGTPVTIIRYNPDGFAVCGRARPVSREVRMDYLTRVVRRELLRPVERYEVRLVQLFYKTYDRTVSDHGDVNFDFERVEDITTVVDPLADAN